MDVPHIPASGSLSQPNPHARGALQEGYPVDLVDEGLWTIEQVGHPVAQQSLGSGVTVTFVAAWVASGLLTASLLQRRGHRFRPSAFLASAFGPLFILLALQYMRDDELEAAPRVLSHGSSAGGPVNVLLGSQRPPSAVIDALPLLDLLGPRLGRLTLCEVIDYQAASDETWCEDKRAAALDLEVAGALLGDRVDPGAVLVPGPYPDAILRYADRQGYDMVLLSSEDRPGRTDRSHRPH